MVALDVKDTLERANWQELEAIHKERADKLTTDYRTRRVKGEKHPVEDFLYTYYSFKPSQLRRWHAGGPIELIGAQNTERKNWRWYRDTNNALIFDVERFMEDRGNSVLFIHEFLKRSKDRKARFDCFGLHEWAMVYKLKEDDIRHQVPLRLGSKGTDEVVATHQLRCSHFDAFRFYTKEAKPLNTIQPTRATQIDLDQPGCLHTGMDLYKWAYKLGPVIPGYLLLDCFELTHDIRVLDMQAAPYDLSDWGYEPVKIETPAGKAEYVKRQKEFTERGNALRKEILKYLENLMNVINK
ncbi:MAG: 3-methyladenine DNA glycosylase [Micrococcaceae bacterium]